MSVGQKLKSIRVEKGFSQRDIALFLDMNENTYRNYETGQRSPDFDMLDKLSKFFDKSILDFLPTESITLNQTNQTGSTGYSAYIINHQLSEKVDELTKQLLTEMKEKSEKLEVQNRELKEENKAIMQLFINKIEQLVDRLG